jgi:hypothetical protein
MGIETGGSIRQKLARSPQPSDKSSFSNTEIKE